MSRITGAVVLVASVALSVKLWISLRAVVGAHEVLIAFWLVALFLSALWRIPKWQVANLDAATPSERFDRENEARKTLAQIIGGALLLVGLYYTAQTVRVSEDKQVTERFTRAVEHLGHPTLQVRLGGIYALERIASDSPRDVWSVMDILSAYVRAGAGMSPAAMRAEVERARASSKAQPFPDLPSGTRLSEDIQAVLSVIGRQNAIAPPGHLIDLGRTNLASAILFKAQLPFVSFSFANLELANLMEANLQGAWLVGANLRWANLEGADLGSANLNSADLRRANLKNVNLRDTNLRRADLSLAENLTKEQLVSARIDEATKLPESLKHAVGRP